MVTRIVVAVVVFVFRIGINNKVTSNWAYGIYLRFMQVNSRTPKWWLPTLCYIDCSLQGDLSVKLGLPICPYCHWIIGDERDQGHDYCADQMVRQQDLDDEIEAAWEAYEAEMAKQADEEPAADDLPWDSSDYYNLDDYYDDDEEYEPTKVYLGDPGDEGGFIIYE